MTLLTRLFFCAVAASGLLITTASVSPEWFTSVGLDVWTLPELHSQMARHRAKAAVMDAEAALVKERLDAKLETTIAVIEGRVSLLSAAARFGQLNRQHPPSMRHLHLFTSGNSENEKLCRQVIGWVSNQLPFRRTESEAERVVDRLEKQLQAHLEKHGRVILPEN